MELKKLVIKHQNNRLKCQNLNNNTSHHGVDLVKVMVKKKEVMANNNLMVKLLVAFSLNKINLTINKTTIHSLVVDNTKRIDHHLDNHINTTTSQRVDLVMSLHSDKGLRLEAIVDRLLKNHL